MRMEKFEKEFIGQTGVKLIVEKGGDGSGFSKSTVWLIFAAHMVGLGYKKTGLGHRVALSLLAEGLLAPGTHFGNHFPFSIPGDWGSLPYMVAGMGPCGPAALKVEATLRHVVVLRTMYINRNWSWHALRFPEHPYRRR